MSNLKKQIRREEVSELLVSDEYFTKKHVALKFWQTLVAILGWISVFVPFIWLSIPSIFPNFAKKYSFYTYVEELQALKFLLLFLAISFLFILVFYICLTIWNNYRFNYLLQRKKLYDEEKLEKRKQLLEEAYTERFCTEEIRHTVKFYSVSEEQNFDKDFVKKKYKDNGVSL